MEQVRREAGPAAYRQGGPVQKEMAGVGSTHQAYSITEAGPVALAVHKPGRGRDGWPVVAKLTRFYPDSEPILAVCWRGQQGRRESVSLPELVLTYAEAAGARRFFLRDDRQHTMRTCELGLFRQGELASDGEYYVPLVWLEPVAWQDWLYATDVLRLGDPIGGAQHDMVQRPSAFRGAQ